MSRKTFVERCIISNPNHLHSYDGGNHRMTLLVRHWKAATDNDNDSTFKLWNYTTKCKAF